MSNAETIRMMQLLQEYMAENLTKQLTLKKLAPSFISFAGVYCRRTCNEF